jgi:SsrA-binding protein
MAITENKKAFHDYHIEDRYEAGIMLEGWEVKAIRAGGAQLKEAYVITKGGEIFLFGCHITPLPNISGFITSDPTRTRKLLLNKDEIDKMIVKVARSGYTMVPLNLHYKSGRIKLEIGMAKGKKQHDKRDADKDRDQKREVQQAMKQNSR